MFGFEPTVRPKGDAMAYVQTYFSKEEFSLFSQWLPRLYCICAQSILLLSAYASLFAFPFLVFPSAKLPLTIWIGYVGCLLIRAYVFRICSNLVVVTQQAFYRYFRIQEERVDEIRWEEVQTVTIRPWRIAPSLATVTLRRHKRRLRELPLVSRLRLYRDRYKRPETLDFRALSLNRPHSIRVVVRRHGELYERCKQLKDTEGYTYIIRRKEKKRCFGGR